VYSGLGRYGRNNICYIDGMGSYFNLKAYYTDVLCDDISYPLRFLDECKNCSLCRKNCPTGAIGENPVIDAAHCLTMYNENKDPMPGWMPQNAHHSLIGCLCCQEVCPVNRALPATPAAALELDEAETQAVLAPAAMPPELVQKFRDFGMHEYFLSVLGRNARLVLHINS
ncbi:MAG: hypothetical protein FWF22_04875, partial [Treponema sp.]|nr:hypothetical protein [Treponema sp.]